MGRHGGKAWKGRIEGSMEGEVGESMEGGVGREAWRGREAWGKGSGKA